VAQRPARSNKPYVQRSPAVCTRKHFII